jgi:NDP-sugar pyrophosphorylase family protein
MTGQVKGIDFPGIAVVLAGGLGTRLQSRSSGIPKVLVQAGGKPFLSYVLTYLASQDIKQVILSTGYLAEQVQSFAGDGSHWGLEITYILEKEPLGTGGALRLASQSLQSAFFALNGDTLFLIRLKHLWDCHKTARTQGTVALRRVERNNKETQLRGFVKIDHNNHILGFEEKPGTLNTADYALTTTSWTNGGIYVLEPSAFDQVAVGENISLEYEMFPRWAEAGKLAGCPLAGYFIDIGTPQSLDHFDQDILKGVFTGIPQTRLMEGE